MKSMTTGADPNTIRTPCACGGGGADLSRAATAAALFAFLLCLYCLTGRNTLQVDDEQVLMARAQSVALQGRLDYPQLFGNDRVRSLSTIGAVTATSDVALEPGQAWLGGLLYRLAAASGNPGAQAALTLNRYATALTGALVYVCIAELGFSASTAILSALLFGTATMAWPYAGTFFRDSLAMAMTTLSMLGWVLLVRERARRPLAGSLLVAAGVVGGAMCKVTSLAIVPAFGIGLLCELSILRKPILLGRTLFVSGTLILLVVLAALQPPVGVLARISLRYWLGLAFQAIRMMPSEVLLAALGPLLSPAKSVFLFSPILVLAPLAMTAWPRSRRASAWVSVSAVLFLCLAQGLGLRSAWAGTLIWGLRFMLPAIPLMMILSAPLIELWLRVNSAGLKAAGVLLGLASIWIQVAGAIVSWATPFVVWAAQGLDPYNARAVWSLDYLSIPIHVARLGLPESWESIGWIRTWASSPAWLIPLGSVSISILAILLLRRKISAWAAPGIVVAALVFPFYPSLPVLRSDPYWGGDRPELTAIATRVADAARAGDLILVDSYGSPLWRLMLNQWTSPLRWYSLPEEYGLPSVAPVIPLELRRLVQSAVRGGRTVWLLCSSLTSTGDCSPIATEVSRMLGPGVTETFQGTGSARLQAFCRAEGELTTGPASPE